MFQQFAVNGPSAGFWNATEVLKSSVLELQVFYCLEWAFIFTTAQWKYEVEIIFCGHFPEMAKEVGQGSFASLSTEIPILILKGKEKGEITGAVVCSELAE